MNDIDRLRNLVHTVCTSEQSSFYRDHFEAAGMSVRPGFPVDIAAWRTLPFLTKKDLVDTPFLKRLFVEPEDAGAVRLTSGTSGRGILLFPRNEPSLRPEMQGTCTSILSFYFPQYAMDEWSRLYGIRHVGAVPGEPTATARLASLMQVDAIAGSPNAIVAIVPHLKRVYDTGRIHYLLFFGGRASKAQSAELSSAFPNARITWEYSSIEGNGRTAVACREKESAWENHLHFQNERCFVEIRDPRTGAILDESGSEGELILTTTWRSNALPVLRYRTGDLIRKVATSCSCTDASATYQIMGRIEFDRVAIAGGQLQSQELERVLDRFSDAIESDFELHVHRGRLEPSTRLVLHIRPRNGTVDTGEILRVLKNSMRIAPDMTLGQALEQKLLLSLECVLLFTEPNRGRLTRIREYNE